MDGKVVPPNEMAGDGGSGGDGKEVIVFLHGLLGNAKNLRTPAKKLTQQLPHFNALLLDIRGHGNSSTSSTSSLSTNKTSRLSSSSPFLRPHNFQSCVQDIFDTLSPLGLTGSNSPKAICGHSLGGRIALQYSHSLCTTAIVTDAPTKTPRKESHPIGIEPPRQTWVLDAVPGRADPSVHNVLRAVSSLPTPIPSKSWLVDTLVKEYGMSKGVAMWMATNLRDNGQGGDVKSFDWIFDLDIANDLVENFSEQDIVEMIRGVTSESTALAEKGVDNGRDNNSTVQLVMAGKNKLWSEAIVSKLESLPSFNSSSSSSLFQMHTLDKAGHWVHVDDLEGLLKLMVDGLQQP